MQIKTTELKKLTIKTSLKVEKTPTHHRRETYISGTTQAKIAKFKATSNKPFQKRHRYSVPNALNTLRYIIIQ